jgi:hypothetical protein
MSENKETKSKPSTLPGIAALGLLVTGVAGIHHAYATGSGLGLLAAAISFGCIFVAAFL